MKEYDFEIPDESGGPLERDHALWGLLGQAKEVEVSPFFSRDVLRQIRLAQRREVTQPFSMFKRWRPVLIGATGLAVVVVNGIVLMGDFEKNSPQRTADAEAISHLDELLAYEPTDVWLDKSVY